MSGLSELYFSIASRWVVAETEWADRSRFDLFKNFLVETFGHRKDILLINERHLHIELGEFRLTVSAAIFVAETFNNLEITVHARDHKDLLEQLWGLRQREEFAQLQT